MVKNRGSPKKGGAAPRERLTLEPGAEGIGRCVSAGVSYALQTWLVEPYWHTE